MKSKLLLCLALVLSGGLFACATVRRCVAGSALLQGPGTNGLTCYISVPTPKPSKIGHVQAALVLKNESTRSIRVCTWCVISISSMNVWRSIILSPGAANLQTLAKHITTLRPGEEVPIPFSMDVFTNNDSMFVTARYIVSANSGPCGGEGLDMWRGNIEATPLTVQIER